MARILIQLDTAFLISSALVGILYGIAMSFPILYALTIYQAFQPLCS
jgi:hypothetical protein